MIIARKYKGLTLGLLVATLMPVVALAGGGTFQSVNLQHVGSGDLALGAGTLNRQGDSIQVRVTGTGFDATAVYSAWFIIFNNSRHCATVPCSPADVGNPKTKAAVLNAGGFISGADGTGYFTGTLEAGPAPRGMCCFGKLKNGRKAEVHIVLQTHGAPVQGTVDVNMSTPNGVDQFFLVYLPTNGNNDDDSDSD